MPGAGCVLESLFDYADESVEDDMVSFGILLEFVAKFFGVVDLTRTVEEWDVISERGSGP